MYIRYNTRCPKWLRSIGTGCGYSYIHYLSKLTTVSGSWYIYETECLQNHAFAKHKYIRRPRVAAEPSWIEPNTIVTHHAQSLHHAPPHNEKEHSLKSRLYGLCNSIYIHIYASKCCHKTIELTLIECEFM